MKPGIWIESPRSFDDIMAALPELLKAEGFGIVSTIDMQATFKAKLGEERPPYTIIGACKPNLAFKAVQAHPEIGLALPCNIAIYVDAAGGSHVGVVDPVAMIADGDAVLQELADAVDPAMRRVLAALEA